jgi:uncharacterized protein (TIGR03067 family)
MERGVSGSSSCRHPDDAILLFACQKTLARRRFARFNGSLILPRVRFIYAEGSMFKCFLAAVALAMMTAVCAADEDAASAEMKELEGTWQLVSAVKDGKETPDEVVQKIRVVIKAGKHSVYFGDEVAVKEVPFAVDPTTNPKTTLDTLPDGKEIKGIYKLNGDSLISCVADVGEDRPSEFVSKPGSGHTLRTFKRVAP